MKYKIKIVGDLRSGEALLLVSQTILLLLIFLVVERARELFGLELLLQEN